MITLNIDYGSKCPALIADYENHLRLRDGKRKPFSVFCRMHNIRPATATQWMSRHGISVSKLRYEAMLEGYTDSSEQEPPPLDVGEKHSQRQHVLKGVSVTFPDGTVVSIRQTRATVLSEFIECYNAICDKCYVRPE